MTDIVTQFYEKSMWCGINIMWGGCASFQAHANYGTRSIDFVWNPGLYLEFRGSPVLVSPPPSSPAFHYAFSNLIINYVIINILAMSLESDPWQHYTPPPYFFDWYNRKGRKCRRYKHTARGDHYKALFCMGGYNSAQGLISREITNI